MKTSWITLSLLIVFSLLIGLRIHDASKIEYTVHTPVLSLSGDVTEDRSYCDLPTVTCDYANKINAKVYAYSSTVDQTDNSPFITANGYNLYYNRDGIHAIANNCLEFGTVVQINKTNYTVVDRMNRKYGTWKDGKYLVKGEDGSWDNCEDAPYVFDIWFESRQEALDWGVRNLEITVL